MTTIVCCRDLMDRSRFGQGLPGCEFVEPEQLLDRVSAEAEALERGSPPPAVDVFVDLTMPGALEAVRAVHNRVASVVGFCPHVDDRTMADGLVAGCREVLPRSVLFRRIRPG